LSSLLKTARSAGLRRTDQDMRPSDRPAGAAITLYRFKAPGDWSMQRMAMPSEEAALCGS
jgi:hypothetical protein